MKDPTRTTGIPTKLLQQCHGRVEVVFALLTRCDFDGAWAQARIEGCLWTAFIVQKQRNLCPRGDLPIELPLCQADAAGLMQPG